MVSMARFGKSRGTSDGASTIIQDDDCLGVISWNAGDGNDMTSQGAAIYCDIDGTPGADDTPARLEFHTCPDGSSTAVERMRINSSGYIGIGAANPTYALMIQGAGNAPAGMYLYNDTGAEGIKIVPESNGNCRIYASTNDALCLGTNDTDRITIDADGANTTFTGTITIPTWLVHSGDSNTYFGFEGPDTITATTGGTERLRITDSLTTVKNGLVVDHSDWNSMRLVNTNANTYGAYIDLVHSSASPADGDEAGEVRFLANNSAGGETVFGQVRVCSSDVTDGAEDGYFEFQLRNNDTLEEKLTITHAGKVHSKNAVQSGGNTTGGFQFDAVDTACVLGIQQPSSGADTNAAIQVYDGTSNNLRVNYSGLIKTSAGVDFSGAQTNAAGMTSETLDGYEEGTWTPVLRYYTSGSWNNNCTFSDNPTTNNATYTKIGRLVKFQWYSTLMNIDVGAGYPAGIEGLPFTAASNYQAVVTAHVDCFETESQNGYVATGSDRIVFTKVNDVNLCNWKTSNGYIMVAGSYETA